MAKLSKSWKNDKTQLFKSSNLKYGELMEDTDGCVWMRIISGLVNLTSPTQSHTLNQSTIPTLYGRKLQPGESITLTQE